MSAFIKQTQDIFFQESGSSGSQTVHATIQPSPTEDHQLCSVLCEADIAQQGRLVLVNKWKLWPEGVEPENLVDIKDYMTSSAYALKDNRMRADRNAVIALDQMMRQVQAEGIRNIVVMSSYRGYQKQRILFSQQVELMLSQTESRKQAEETANKTVARPGESEHHTGLAFDLAVGGIDMGQFGDTPQGQWVREHCAEYGFIIRYQHDKADITGIDNEPWHIRYVGIEAAREMEQNGWCLEEYIEHRP